MTMGIVYSRKRKMHYDVCGIFTCCKVTMVSVLIFYAKGVTVGYTEYLRGIYRPCCML